MWEGCDSRLVPLLRIRRRLVYLRPVRGCIKVGCVLAALAGCCLGLLTFVLLLANSSRIVWGMSGSNLTPCCKIAHKKSDLWFQNAKSLYRVCRGKRRDRKLRYVSGLQIKYDTTMQFCSIKRFYLSVYFYLSIISIKYYFLIFKYPLCVTSFIFKQRIANLTIISIQYKKLLN